jgi:hypothetical protein
MRRCANCRARLAFTVSRICHGAEAHLKDAFFLYERQMLPSEFPIAAQNLRTSMKRVVLYVIMVTRAGVRWYERANMNRIIFE